MAKKIEVQKDRNGKDIEVGCKVRYDKLIWEVVYSSPNRVSLLREKRSRLYPDAESSYIVARNVNADKLEVINKK